MADKTVEAWRNLWFHTGDRVVRDADGYYRFLDRMKDAIRRRGENISSYEVEQVLLAHPAIAAVAVYAVQSELAEDEVMAALVYKRAARWRTRSCWISVSRACRTSRCHAICARWTNCRAPRTARFASSSCATKA